MAIRVECYAGNRGEQEPRAIWPGERRFDVVEVLDRWLHPDEWDLAGLVGASFDLPRRVLTTP